jgi:uncharacterized membrane protein
MSSSDTGLAAAMLSTLAIQSPLFLAWIVGIALAVINWRRHPARSLLVTIALAIMLVVGVVGGAIQAVLPFTLIDQGMSASQMGVVFSALGLVRILLDTAAWALLLVALFRRRDEVPPPRF